MSAQKKVTMETTLRMIPECHPNEPFQVPYIPERGGDRIHVKCSQCYRIAFNIKLPSELKGSNDK